MLQGNKNSKKINSFIDLLTLLSGHFDFLNDDDIQNNLLTDTQQKSLNCFKELANGNNKNILELIPIDLKQNTWVKNLLEIMEKKKKELIPFIIEITLPEYKENLIHLYRASEKYNKIKFLKKGAQLTVKMQNKKSQSMKKLLEEVIIDLLKLFKIFMISDVFDL